ncbi:unnamed protein product [Camellia sinensis]
MEGGNHHDDESSDRGLFSHLAGYATGQYPPSYGAHPPQGYPLQGYLPQGYPPQGYPPQAYSPAGYPPAGGYPPAQYPFPGWYPPAGYPGPSVSISCPRWISTGNLSWSISSPSFRYSHGPNMGALIAGGAAAAAAAYGAHQLSHGAHNLTHGGCCGHHHGKFKHGKHGGKFMNF